MKISPLRLQPIIKHNVFFIIFLLQLIESLGKSRTTHEGILASTFNEGEAFPLFILVICHMAIDEEWVEAPFNLVIALECAIGRLRVNI